jgi:hypothetical protein
MGFLCAKMKKAALVDEWSYLGEANAFVDGARAGWFIFSNCEQWIQNRELIFYYDAARAPPGAFQEIE